MENMIKFGYRGKIYPVNPNASEILGIKAYPDIKRIGHRVELAVISTPRDITVEIIRECADVGIKAAVVVNQGFADSDQRGKLIQKEMVAVAKRSALRILGPNTLGVVNNFAGFTTSFMPLQRERSPLGLICQSGIFFVGASTFTGPIGKGIDLGNACDIGFCEALQYLGGDPDIKIVAIHMEGLQEGRRFLSVASEVAKHKPVVVFKTGRTQAGARAAASHSGTMAGNFAVHRAALEQAAVAVLDETGQMQDAVKTLLYLPPLRGDRIAVITPTGAGGIIATDALARYGLRLARLSRNTTQQLQELSPEWMPIGNPMDIWPAAMKHGLQRVYSVALRAVLEDPNVDGLLCIALAPKLPEYAFLDLSETLNQLLIDAPKKPVVAWLYGPDTEEIRDKFEQRRKLLVYRTLERAAWALSLLKDRMTH